MSRFRRTPESPALGLVLPLVVLACILMAPAASSQEATGGAFGESVDVVVVGVEAVVTDGQGHRVPGLTPEDFRLLVDGREVPVEYFAEVRDGLAQADRRAPGAAGAVDRVEPVPTNYLVFVDDYFNKGSRRNWMLDRILERVSELPAQDRMAVVAFDGDGIEVLAQWSDSRATLRSALLAAKNRPAKGLYRSHEWERRAAERSSAPFASNWSWSNSRPPILSVDANGTVRSVGPVTTAGEAFYEDNNSHTRAVLGTIEDTDSRLLDPFHDIWSQDLELHRVLTAVESTMTVIPRPEGRNVLFLLAGAWPFGSTTVLRPHEESILHSLPTGYGRQAPLDDLAMVLPVIDTANLLGYTIYPVDVDGYRASVESTDAFRQGTLRELAGSTGGRALLFGARKAALETVVEDTRTYYSLGFTPELSQDNAYHDIQVEVRRPDLDIRARAGYRDFALETELDAVAESVLQFGRDDGRAPDAGTLSVSLGTPQRRPKNTMKVPLTVEVPWSQITVLPEGAQSVGHLEIRLAARDRDGALSEVATVPVRVVRADEQAPAEPLRWETDLLLRRTRHNLVVSVYDAPSGRVLTQVVSVGP